MALRPSEYEYPAYFKTPSSLMAFTGPDKMFMITNGGSNKNPGVCLDHYITRRMVIQYYPGKYSAYRITAEQFKAHYEKLYIAYLTHILK